MKLGATLYVDSIEKSYEAVELYKQAFGLTLGFNESYEDTSWMKKHGIAVADDYVPQKGYFHAELVYNGETIFAVSAEGDSGEVHNHIVELALKLDSVEAVTKAVSILSEGTISALPNSINACSASVIDKYGVKWWIHV